MKINPPRRFIRDRLQQRVVGQTRDLCHHTLCAAYRLTAETKSLRKQAFDPIGRRGKDFGFLPVTTGKKQNSAGDQNQNEPDRSRTCFQKRGFNPATAAFGKTNPNLTKSIHHPPEPGVIASIRSVRHVAEFFIPGFFAQLVPLAAIQGLLIFLRQLCFEFLI